MDGNMSITKLEGSKNWNIWKFQMRVVLRGQDLLDVVEGKQEKTKENEKTWEMKDAKAQTLIVTRICDEVMIHIISCITSAEMWKKLTAVYEQRSETNIHIIQQRFFQFKYEEGIQMSIFLSKIKEMQNQLQQLGEEISERFVITKVLMSLPDRFKHFISAWESAPDEKQTYDNLVARLLIEEERMKEKGDEMPESSSAFVAKRAMNKKNVKCYKCNKLGHYQSECRSKVKDSDPPNRFGKRCFYCNKVGHLKTECRFRINKESNAFVMLESADNSEKQYTHSKWVVDTGASEHMCRDKQLFTSYSSLDKKSVIVGNGTAISALGCGQVTAQVFDGYMWIQTTIDNVLFVPELKTNLLSVNRVTEKGYVMKTNQNQCNFYKNEKLCAVANRCENMYIMDLRLNCSVANTTQVKFKLSEWHEKLAHQNIQHVKKVLSNNNIEVDDDFNGQCQGCLKGKAHRLPFKTSVTTTSRTCELIHADVCGPMEEISIGGARYFLLLKDDFSNYRTVYFLKGKHEVKVYVEKFIKMSENITGNKIKYFRSDNGLEFVNRDIKKLFSHCGILHQTTVTYTPEQNGKAERENRTLVEAARSLLYAKSLPKKLWAEATNTACYVLNRTGLSSDKVKTPYEAWTGKRFDIQDLKIFGTPVFVHIPREKRTKWDSKGENAILVGYGEETKGYRVYFEKKNTVQIKRDIVFLEKPKEISHNVTLWDDKHEEVEVPNQSMEESSHELSMASSDSSECCSLYEPYLTGECSSDEPDETSQPEKREPSKRIKKQTSFYQCNNVVLDEVEPRTYKEAMEREDASKWKEAIDKEVNTLNENKTWEYCEKPDNCKVITSKWVFRIKNMNGIKQYKARLVARGFEQNDDLDLNDIYAPVAKLTTFRLFVSIATMLKLPIHQMDVTGAFLYGEINENVYLQLPEGLDNENGNVVKLQKSLYGLKKSPKYWNDKFNRIMFKDKFIKSKCDPCLYMKCNGEDKVYVLLYVDDILIFGTDETTVNDFKEMLCREFKMKSLGFISEFIGINVKQDLKTGVTELSQKVYLENILKRFHMENCKPISSPMDQNFNINIIQSCNEKSTKTVENLCRQIIGCLMYAVCGTRPDLSVVVSILSRFQNKANAALLSALKRVLRYIKHTLDYKLVYKCDDTKLIGYCDANWGGDLLDRKSTTGYCFMFNNCLIAWCSKKQGSVSLSSTESEYISLSMAASEACWLVNILKDFFPYESMCPVKILCDNQSAIKVAMTDCVKRLKHIDIRYHFIREMIKKDKIAVMFIKTEDQVADALTKPLNATLLLKFVKNVFK